MPMPEMPKVFVNLWFKKPISIEEQDMINRTWDKDRKACFAAGKADALPQWPPDGGKRFLYKGDNIEPLIYAGYDGTMVDGEIWLSSGRWCSTFWEIDRETGEKYPAEDFIDSPEAEVIFTAAYFRGELEEVKEVGNGNS